MIITVFEKQNATFFLFSNENLARRKCRMLLTLRTSLVLKDVTEAVTVCACLYACNLILCFRFFIELIHAWGN